MGISIVEETKEYVVLKVPRRLLERANFSSFGLTENQAFTILKAGMREYKQGKTKPLRSLRDLRHGN